MKNRNLNDSEKDFAAKSFIAEFMRSFGPRDVFAQYRLVAMNFGICCACRLFPNLPSNPNAIVAVTA